MDKLSFQASLPPVGNLGACMDLSRIPLVKLAQAYGLRYQECRGLAEKLQAQAEYYGETLFLAEIDEAANDLPSKIDFRVLMLDEFETYLKINSILLPEIYRDHIAGGRIFRWTDELRHIAMLTFAAYLVGIATVEKEAAIKYLYENGYSLVMEVQGISQSFVEKILNQKNGSEQSTGERTGISGANNSPNAGAPIPPPLWKSREENISKWRKAMDSFTEKERKIVQVIIGKFQGKSHTDICEEIFGNNVADPPGKIKKLKNRAQALADERGLPMPEWDSRNK